MTERKDHHAAESGSVDLQMLCLAGGAAFVVLGAGLMLSHPRLRKSLEATIGGMLPDLREPLQKGLSGLLPDIDRYMKLRSM